MSRDEIGGGRYRLNRQVGGGGMGKVWKAHDTFLGRTVAIKEVALELIAPVHRDEYLKRATTEARNAAALADHPNIVTVYDVVVEDDVPWTVMQYVDGMSLAEALRRGPMLVEEAAALAEQMLSALAFAHRAGIVHRDVKPLNIMIDGDGRALLADFGISKRSEDTVLTQAGLAIGSAPYMAPERHEGVSGTPASDLFSLGVTLFEAVEGYSPFAKKTRTDTVTSILAKPLPATRRAGRLDALIRALTAKDPTHRPTAEQASADVKRPPTKPIVDKPVVPHSPGTRWRLAGRLSLGESLSGQPICLAFSSDRRAIAVGGTGSGPANRGSLALFETRTGRRIRTFGTLFGPVHNIVFRPDGRRLLTIENEDVALWTVTPDTWQTSTAKRLGSISPDGNPDHIFSPDSTLLIRDDNKQRILVMDASKGRQTSSTFTTGSEANAFAFTPDGREVVVASGGDQCGIRFWQVSPSAVATKGKAFSHPAGPPLPTAVACTPNGMQATAVFGKRNSALAVTWDISMRHRRFGKSGGFPVSVPLYGDTGLQRPLFVDDARSLVYHDGTRLFVFTLATRRTEQLRLGTGPTAEIVDTAVSLSGKTIAAITRDGAVYLWTAQGKPA